MTMRPCDFPPEEAEEVQRELFRNGWYILVRELYDKTDDMTGAEYEGLLHQAKDGRRPDDPRLPAHVRFPLIRNAI